MSRDPVNQEKKVNISTFSDQPLLTKMSAVSAVAKKILPLFDRVLIQVFYWIRLLINKVVLLVL